MKLQAARYFAINRSVISNTTRHEKQMQRHMERNCLCFSRLGKVEKVCGAFPSARRGRKYMGQPRHVPFYGFILTTSDVVSGILRFF